MFDADPQAVCCDSSKAGVATGEEGCERCFAANADLKAFYGTYDYSGNAPQAYKDAQGAAVNSAGYKVM